MLGVAGVMVGAELGGGGRGARLRGDEGVPTGFVSADPRGGGGGAEGTSGDVVPSAEAEADGEGAGATIKGSVVGGVAADRLTSIVVRVDVMPM